VKKRRRSSPTDPFADLVKRLSGGFVDPQPALDAEFERAKRDLLANFETDMSLWDKIRFRYELWKLRNRYRKVRRNAGW
jgi:hypothetical protein